jgi:pSer/pThr/pTyr-binding forkhead associated (FHA) protein
MNLPGMTPFLEACGATSPLRVGIASTYQRTAVDHILHQPFALIGRDPRADLILAGPEISKRHAYIQVLDGQAFCLDLDSRTGILRDGRLAAADWVNPDQNLGFGPFSLSIHEGCIPIADVFNPLITQDPEPAGLPKVGLTFTKGISGKVAWTMNCRLALIGESPQCKVCLSGPSISRFQCSLVRCPGSVWVVGLIGKGGIRVNGRPVRYALLQAGDRLQLGRFEVEVAIEAARPTVVDDGAASEGLFAPPALRAESATPLDVSRHGGPMTTVFPPVEAYSASLVQQFASMQNEVFDQFQLAMVHMVRLFGRMHQEEMTHLRQELTDLCREQMIHLHQEVKALRRDDLAQISEGLTALRLEEMGLLGENLKDLRREEIGQIQDGLIELRQHEMGQIEERLTKLRQEEFDQIQGELKGLRQEELCQIQEKLLELRQEEQRQIRDGLNDLRQEEKGRFHEELKGLREEERTRIGEELKGLREEERSQIQDRLKDLRQEDRAQIHQELKGLREAQMAHVQGQLNEMRAEEKARIQQELKELREVNRELQELRSQLSAVPAPVSNTPSQFSGAATSEHVPLDLTLAQMEKRAAGNGVLNQANDRDPNTVADGPKPIAPEGSTLTPTPAVPELQAPISKAPAVRAASQDRTRPANPAHSDPDALHAKLCLRMASLQSESRTRWQRILGMLSGAAK